MQVKMRHCYPDKNRSMSQFSIINDEITRLEFLEVGRCVNEALNPFSALMTLLRTLQYAYGNPG